MPKCAAGVLCWFNKVTSDTNKVHEVEGQNSGGLTLSLVCDNCAMQPPS